MALCPHLQGQRWSGAGDLCLWLAVLHGAGRRLTSLSRSFRTRSTTSTSDLPFIQTSMFWGTRQGHRHQGPCPPAPSSRAPPAQPLRAGPVAPLYSPSDSSPYRLTDGLEVQGLQLLGHLFASLSVPAIEMRGLEKPPVGAGTVALGLSPCAEGGTAPSSRCPRTSPAVHPPVEAQPVPLEDAGELGPCVLQAAQEVILAEGADLGRGLRQRPGEPGGLRGHRLTGSARGSGPHRALARRMP